MSATCWTLQADRATARFRLGLKSPEVCLTLPLSALADGMSVSAAKSAAADRPALARFFCLSHPSAEALGLPNEMYTRQADVLATYEATSGRDYRLQLRVSARSRTLASGRAITWQAVLSVQTQLLDLASQLEVSTRLDPAGSARAAQAISLLDQPALPGLSPVIWDAGQRGFACCWPGELETTDCLWLEGVHPEAPSQTTLQSCAGGEQYVHRLFDQGLEKGVILRARTLGGVIEGDSPAARLAVARQVWHDFVNTPPPLST